MFPAQKNPIVPFLLGAVTGAGLMVARTSGRRVPENLHDVCDHGALLLFTKRSGFPLSESIDFTTGLDGFTHSGLYLGLHQDRRSGPHANPPTAASVVLAR